MKRSKFITLMVLVMFGFLFNLNAQEKEKTYQLYQISEDQVKPSMVYEYEEVLKEYVAYLKEHNFKYPVSTFRTDDFHYYFASPIESSLADVDTFYNALGKVAAKDREKWKSIFKKFDGTYYYNKSYIMVYLAKLSFDFEDPDFKGNEKHYAKFRNIHVKVGKSSEFAEVCKKWAAFYKKNNIPFGFETYQGAYGTEQPYYVWISRGNNLAEYSTKSMNEMKKITSKEVKKEYSDLWKETLKTIEDIDIKDGYYMPEFSYRPKK